MKILIVDDNLENRISLKDFLMDIDHQVMEAGDGKAALKLLKDDHFNLVISDIRMPKLSGTELLTAIKEDQKLKDIEIILITAYGDVKSAVEAMHNGAYEYLLKPININELTLLIDKIDNHQKLKEELKSTSRELAKVKGVKEIVANSKSMQKVYDLATRLGRNQLIPILLEGETGTGKEVIAKFIHNQETGFTKPFIAINCAAISPSLFESEVFGYEKGAYTGGNPHGKEGKIELAGEGTIFFDEIGELPTELQAKLLRVIQEREFYRVGGNQKIQTKARIICSTNIDINTSVTENKFRKDLFYRLSSGHLKLPPLRERVEDIIPLAEIILREICLDNNFGELQLSEDAKDFLKVQKWDGNIRQLKHLLQRSALLTDKQLLDQELLNSILQFGHTGKIYKSNKSDKKVGCTELTGEFILPEDGFDLNSWNLKIVEKALLKFKWNKTETAEYLGLSRTNLYTLLKKIKQQK